MECSSLLKSVKAQGLAVLAGAALFGVTSPLNAAEYVVKLRGNNSGFRMAMHDFQMQTKFAVLDQHEGGQLLKIDIPGGDRLVNTLAGLMMRPDVQYVVPNVRFYKVGAQPDDPRLSEQWSLAKVNATKAWETQVGSDKIVVAVIDTGIDHKHPDLADNMWVNAKEVAGNGKDDDGNGFIDDINGWDFRENDADPMDETSSKNPGHGTHCAGIVGAVGNNSKGISGMSQVTSLMAVRFLGSDGSGDLMSGAKAIDYAVNNGAHIISASWGAAVPRSGAQPIIDAIQRANEKGVIFIAAAANDGKSNDTREVYPANAGLANMISVAASQADDSKPSWSNYGQNKVHLSSPGHNILSTLPGDKYGPLSGTSMATPLVSGLASLLLSEAQVKGQKIDGLTMRSLLQTTGTKVAIETACDCRVDAAAAVKAVTDEKMTVVPAAITIGLNETQQFGAFGAVAPLKFAVADANVATIDDKGMLTAKAKGETTVSVTDAKGTTAQSMRIRIADAAPPPGEGEQCPIDDPIICMGLCLISPELPWCADLPIPQPNR